MSLRIVNRSRSTIGDSNGNLGSLSHTKWECKYHVVFIRKCRKKVLYGQLRRELGPVFRELAERTECRIEEGHLMIDHVHMLISIPPKMAVSAAMGFIKGKSAIHIARVYAGRRRSFIGQHFWARGYWVSTVGQERGGSASVHPGAGKGRPALGSTGAKAALSGSRKN